MTFTKSIRRASPATKAQPDAISQPVQQPGRLSGRPFRLLASSLLLSWQLTARTCEVIVPQPARYMVPPGAGRLAPRLTASGCGDFFNSRERAALFAARAVIPVTALREALCLRYGSQRGLGGQEFLRCPIINGHMSCGLRSPPKRKRSFPILAVMPALKLAGAPKKQAMIPWRGTGALSRRRSLAGWAGAHPCSTRYSVEQADPDPWPWPDVGSATARALGLASVLIFGEYLDRQDLIFPGSAGTPAALSGRSLCFWGLILR